jgi:hypothetical protein
MDYIVSSGTFVAGSSGVDSDVIVYLQDVTNSTFIEPSSFKLLSTSTTIADKFQGTFQTSATGTSYRLLLYFPTTSASAFTLKLDNISISPSNYVFGTPITDWQSYTPTFTGFGTPTNVDFKSRRVGDTLEVEGYFTSGTSTATQARITLGYGGANANVVTDSTKASGHIVGAGTSNRFSATTIFGVYPIANASSNYLLFGIQSSTTGGLSAANASSIASSGEYFSFFASVPILGWSSSVQTSDSADTRVVAAQATGFDNVTVGNGATERLTFTTVGIDTHGSVDTSNERINIIVPGNYTANANIYIQSYTPSTAASSIQCKIRVNGGTSYIIGAAGPNGTSAGARQLNCSALIPVPLKCGDYVELLVSQDTGASFTTLGVLTTFDIIRLSGPSAIAASEIIAARYTTTASQSIGAASTVSVYFDSKDFDTHSAVTDSGSTSWTYNALIPGYYRVTMSVVSLANALQQQVYKNGSLYAYLGTTSAAATVPGSTLIQCNAGDKITFQVYNAGGATTLSGNAKANWITIERLGGVM